MSVRWLFWWCVALIASQFDCRENSPVAGATTDVAADGFFNF
jgi:hypothetical protein